MFFKVTLQQFLSIVLQVVLVLPGFLLQTVAAAPTQASEKSEKTAELVWGADVNRNHVLFYSALQSGTWSKPLPLSNQNRNSLVPTLTSDQHGRTFVAWSVLEKNCSFIEYVILSEGQIVQEPMKIETGLSANAGAFLAVDIDGTPWLVWSGNNGTTSDVFYSSWHNGRWRSPKMINDRNNVPDILPELLVGSDASVRVSWKSFSADGSPVALTKQVKEASLLSSAVLKDSRNKTGSSAGILECIPSLPELDIDVDKAVLLNYCGGNVFPTQTRFLGERLKKQRQMQSREK